MKASVLSPSLPAVDDDGLLCNPAEWNVSVAWEIARQVGIKELSAEHWAVIYSLREYYAKFGVAPAMNTVCRRHAKDGQWVHELFATCLNAWRVAGLPNPGEEAKSYLSDM